MTKAKKCSPGKYWCFTDKKCKKIPTGYHVMGGGRLMKDEDHEDGENGKKNGKKNGNGNGNGDSNGGDGGGVSESSCGSTKKRKKKLAEVSTKGYEYSNWRDEFKATEVESVDIVTPEPLQPTEGIGSKMIDEKCWKGYEKKGMKTMFGKRYPNCVKKTRSEGVLDAALETDKKMGELHKKVDKDVKRMKAGKKFKEETEVLEKAMSCWKTHKKVGMKMKGGKLVNDCRPKNEEFSDWRTELEEGNKSGDSSLRDWFGKSRSSDGTPGWVQLGGKYSGKPCAKQPGQTTKPKCGSSKMKRDLNKDEEERAFRRKNREDGNPDRKGKAKNVATESAVPGKPAEKLGAVTAIPKDERDAAKARLLAKAAAKRAKKVSESSGEEDHEFEMARRQLSTMKSAAKKLEKKMGKKGEGNLKAWVQSKITKAADYADTAADYVTKEAAGEKDACYHKVKSRYSVWPSAYASGALVKCRKKGAKNWGNKTKKESYSFEISKSDHKKQTKLGKIRNLSKKGSTEGERAAAKRKLGPSLPSESVIMPGSILPEDYQRIQSYGNVYTIIVLWRGTSRRVQLFFQGTARPSREEVKNEVEKIYPGGMVSYYFPSAADPGQPIIVSTRS